MHSPASEGFVPEGELLDPLLAEPIAAEAPFSVRPFSPFSRPGEEESQPPVPEPVSMFRPPEATILPRRREEGASGSLSGSRGGWIPSVRERAEPLPGPGALKDWFPAGALAPRGARGAGQDFSGQTLASLRAKEWFGEAQPPSHPQARKPETRKVSPLPQAGWHETALRRALKAREASRGPSGEPGEDASGLGPVPDET
ncbi:MAG: hypothetical protein LBG06_00175 [Deltaproteobacteria bacterium]|nr:hypothetical protein [Deltaproteobacteria bacterium]